MLIADLVLLNGKVITADPKDSVAEAVAVESSRVVKVGSNHQIKRLIGKTTAIIDVRGKTVTPGLIDTHAHFAESGINQVYVLNLRYPSVKSIAEAVKLVKTQTEKTPRGRWVQGAGWDEALFDERRYITRWDLDPVSSDHPVLLEHTSGHYIAVNTYALHLANVTRDTPQPNGGTIVKDPDTGEPIGVFIEPPAMDIITNLVPPWTVEEAEAGIKKAQKLFLSEGVTTIKDPGVGDVTFAAYRNLRSRGELKMRIYMLYTVDSLANTEEAVKHLNKGGDNLMKLGGLKMFLDGSGMGRTAWVHKDWNKNFTDKDTGNRGYPVIKLEEFRKMVKVGHKAGFQICVHAIGDRAVDETLSTYEAALAEVHRENSRHSIIHAILPTNNALQKMEKLGNNVVIETQSPFLYFIGDNYAGNFGPNRSRRLIPLKSMLKKGITVGNGSDWSVCPFPPRFGLWGAVVRKTWKGLYGLQPFGTEESITVKEALRTYTTMAARCLFMEDAIGSIEPGKYADFAVWSGDIYTVDVEALKDLTVEMTIVGQEVVYRDPSSNIDVAEAPEKSC
ncbi:MAG: amidohydrolase [Candidatus Bathyarchaeota archaeon]|nr:MAG: amidohydrolase [Candidatus Bathyarchaeota archaeon]